MDGLKEAIEKVVQTSSQAGRMTAIRRVGKVFYIICRKLGMTDSDIISLASEIIGCFSNDLKNLKTKIEKGE